MIAYLIKSILCLLLLWGFYKVALEQVSAHGFKRAYLLAGLALAVILPLITITYEIEVEPQPILEATPIMVEQAPGLEAPTVVTEPFNWPLVLWIIYGAGFLVFAFRFTRNLLHLNKKINENEKVKEPSHINVLLQHKVVPHSFLKFIFLPKWWCGQMFTDENDSIRALAIANIIQMQILMIIAVNTLITVIIH